MSPTSSRRSRLRALSAAGVIALAACSVVPPAAPEDPALELTRVPFFPQTIHQCGPAALATVLAWSGVATTPAELAPEVYIPDRHGSLTVELVAATRRAGRIPWQPHLGADGLIAELRAGNPVLVLQDLGIAWLHRWHYAVVVGYEPGKEVFVLRSGTKRRSLERRRRFLDTWARGDRWAMIALPPDRLPASATPESIVRTLEDSRKFLPRDAPATIYDLALERWPDNSILLFAAANQDYAAGRLASAESRYRALLAESPDHVAGRNNLANLLLDKGCATAAAEEAGTALAEVEHDPQANGAFRGAVEDTLARATAASGAGARPAAGC